MNFSEIDWDFNSAGEWPLSIKITTYLLVATLIIGGWHYQFTADKVEQLSKAEQEVTSALLKYKISWGKAVNLELYQHNFQAIEVSLSHMMALIPSKAEVAILLEDISKTGLASGLEFELFKPSPEIPREDIIELPNKITVVGDYHQLGHFISELAQLPRIVTVNNIAIQAQKKRTKEKDSKIQQARLIMNAMLTTYQEQANDSEEADVLDNSDMVCLEHDGLVIKGCKIKSTVTVNDSELSQRLQTSRKNAFKKKLEPVKQLEPTESFFFKAEGLRDPFVPVDHHIESDLSAKLSLSNSIKPDLNRKKEPLESMSLDTLKMVGTVKFEGFLWGLLKSSDGAVHRVKKDDYVGTHYGRITKISDDKIEISEVIQSSEVMWAKNKAAIALSE